MQNHKTLFAKTAFVAVSFISITVMAAALTDLRAVKGVLARANGGTGTTMSATAAAAAASAVNTAGGLAALDGSAKLPEAQLPAGVLPVSGTPATDNLFGYSGSSVVPITLGTNLSIASGVLNAAGGSSAIVYETQSVPIMLPSGTGAAGFQFTDAAGAVAISAVPKAYPLIWIHVPIGAFDGTNPTSAGFYLTHLTSTTVGVMYNCPWGSAISCTTALSGVTTGYVTETTTILPMLAFEIPANTIGINGKVAIDTIWSDSGDTNTKAHTIGLGATCPGTAINGVSNNTAANIGGALDSMFYNSNSASVQVAVRNNSTIFGFGNRSASYLAIDTSATSYVCISGTTSNTASWIILEAASMTIYPAN